VTFFALLVVHQNFARTYTEDVNMTFLKTNTNIKSFLCSTESVKRRAADNIPFV